MPTPARTSVDQIVAAGRAILEAEGFDGLTMQRVATAVGVRAPSLYKHVGGRGDLVRLITIDVSAELSRTLDAAATSGDPRRDLPAIAATFRSFAHARPEGYALLFRALPDAWRADVNLNVAAFGSLFGAVRALAGPELELEAARTLVAWAHGFVSMELAGAFRMGGDVDRAFAYGAERIVAAIARDATRG